MPSKYVLQQRGASGLENKAEIPALENGKIDMSWLPVVGESGAAIIARGSNANGEWVRWEDGTQICTMRDVVTSEQNMTMGALFSFPASFVASPKLSANVTIFSSQSNSGAFILEVANVSTTHYSIKMQIVVSGGDLIAPPTNNEFMAIAIGRWK